MEHRREDPSGVGGWIEVVQGIPVIIAANHGLADSAVEGVGSLGVTSVTFPGDVGDHGLTSRVEIGVTLATSLKLSSTYPKGWLFAALSYV